MISQPAIYLLLVGSVIAFAIVTIVRHGLSPWPCLLLFLIVLPIEFAFERSLTERSHQRAELEATNELNNMGQRLSGLLGSLLAAVEGLAAYIAYNPNLSQEEFDHFAQIIWSRQKYLLNVAAAPDLVIKMIYPRAGNEQALGLDYMKTPSQREPVVRARDLGQTVLAGPVELVQGGVALIGRMPVYLKEENGDNRFWGVVSATIDARKIFAAAGLTHVPNGLRIAIRGVDGQGSRGDVFFGDTTSIAGDGVIYLPIPVASGSWVISAQYPQPQELDASIWFLRITALLVMTGWLLALLQRHLASSNKTYYEQQILAGEQLMQEASQLAGVAGWKLDKEAKLVHITKEFSNIVGLPQLDFAARDRLVSLFSPEAQAKIDKAVRVSFIGGEPFDIELPLKRGEDSRWLRIIAHPVLQGGKVVELVGAIQDITERKEFLQTIERQATSDSLTGLPNREQFDAFLEKAIAGAARRNQCLAVLFIDLDEFKSVNDNLGHSGGDELLVEAAMRIQGCTRGSDVVARLSGDEFAVILPDITGATAASIVAAKIVAAINQHFEIHAKQIFISASVGVAIYPDDGADAETLVINADQAMYEVKKSMRNDFTFFTQELQQRSEARHHLFNRLSLAVAEQRLEVHYQPIVPIDGSGNVACEALVRWQEDGEYISPESFIPLAEETGLITQIDRFVMQEATTFMESLRGPGVQPPALSVNVSPRIFFDRAGELSRWVDHVKLCARRIALTIEITERLLTQDTPHASNILQQLRTVGVKIAIDDFGTGYSSLSYLAKFPIDTLKVDAFFVSKIPGDPSAVTLTETILGLGHELSLSLVAEGVETAEQLRFLQERGCHCAQGYWLSKPLPAHEFSAWLGTYRETAEAIARERKSTPTAGDKSPC